MSSLSDNKQNYCRNILDCDQETLFDVMRTVQIVSKHLTEHCGYEGVFTQKILPYVKKGGFVMIVVPGLKEQPQGRRAFALAQRRHIRRQHAERISAP